MDVAEPANQDLDDESDDSDEQQPLQVQGDQDQGVEIIELEDQDDGEPAAKRPALEEKVENFETFIKLLKHQVIQFLVIVNIKNVALTAYVGLCK